MKKQCKTEQEDVFDKLLGLGDDSIHKSYYPVLQDKISVLKETEHNLRLIFNNSYDAIIIHDFNGNILDVNDTMLKIYKCNKSQALGWKIEDISEEDVEKNVLLNYWNRVLEGELVVFEWTAKRPLSNELFPAEVALCRTKWNGVDTIQASVRDMTEKVAQRKALEDAMHQLESMNSKLESLVDERTEQLKKTQMELIQREKMASIGQLAAGVAHEINNPLGYIISNVGTLKKYSSVYLSAVQMYKEICAIAAESASEEYIDLYEKIRLFEDKSKIGIINDDIVSLIEESQEGLDRITKIVKGLRDFARESANQELSEYDLNHGIDSTLQIAHNSIKYDAQVKLELSNIPIVLANGSEINQVVLNLVINAVHAIKASGKKGTIRIATYQSEDNVVLEVEDNGIGISNENLIRIFDPFFTTKPVGEGTGLGLSIVYDIIVNKHKGKIDIKSEEGKGTNFIIEIPINNK
jgi:PAS domain S-box-containing protein